MNYIKRYMKMSKNKHSNQLSRTKFKKRSCHDKKRYKDSFQAKRAAYSLQRHANATMRYYKCDLCKGYHLARDSYEKHGEEAINV